MKMLNLLRRKKIWVATARRSAGAAEIDYAEIPEPNMKLSRALLIVLLLHVVAVSGIIAFNVIKTRQRSFVPAEPVGSAATSTAAAAQSTQSSGTSSPRPAPVPGGSGLRDGVKPSVLRAIPVTPDEHKSGHTKPAEHAKVPASSGKIYTVAKGDNPVKIARNLKVSYEDLITLNHIEDPRKLKVGQKLLIPRKTAKTKRATKQNE
jgi:LysM repeat protein